MDIHMYQNKIAAENLNQLVNCKSYKVTVTCMDWKITTLYNYTEKICLLVLTLILKAEGQ